MWKGYTPYKAYYAILRYIASAKAPRELDKVFEMKQDFYIEFSGRIAEAEIKEYTHSIMEIKNATRLDMLAQIMAGKKLSTV